jgi:hypothetical protein
LRLHEKKREKGRASPFEHWRQKKISAGNGTYKISLTSYRANCIIDFRQWSSLRRPNGAAGIQVGSWWMTCGDSWYSICRRMLALRKLMANGSNGFDTCPYFGVIELPLSHSAHVWVFSPTHIYNSQIVGPK